jgi:ectoine hydroxylase-related dioxygenase (phytanoyl-CoA dioxygenase family)
MIRRVMGYLKVREDSAPSTSQHLEEHGYVLVPGVFYADEVTALRDDINGVFDRSSPDERADRPMGANNMFRYAMLNRSALCQQAIGARGILDVLEPLLGEDCHVIANTAWRNPPNSDDKHNGERWHIDAGPHIPLPEGTTWPVDIPHPVFAVGVHIYLQDCTLEDGPTGVIPGSQLSGAIPPRDRPLDDDLTYNGVEVVPLLARAGDVGCFVSDIWHRRMRTLPGDQGRFFLQAHYGRRDIAQRIETTNQVNHLSAESIARATTDRDKTVIGLHQPFFYDG